MAKRQAALKDMVQYTLPELRLQFVPIAVSANGARLIGDGERLLFLVACDGVQALVYTTNGTALILKRDSLRFNRVHGAIKSSIEHGRIKWSDEFGEHDAGPWDKSAVTDLDASIAEAIGMHSSRTFDAKLYHDSKPNTGGLWDDKSSW